MPLLGDLLTHPCRSKLAHYLLMVIMIIIIISVFISRNGNQLYNETEMLRVIEGKQHKIHNTRYVYDMDFRDIKTFVCEKEHLLL